MNFLKQHPLALIVTVLVTGIALFFAARLTGDVIRGDYYARWTMDEAGMLTPETEAELAEVNRRLDGTHGSIVGLVTVQSLSGRDPGEYAYGLYESCGVGQNDMILLLSADGTWYLAYGDRVAPYVDNSLRLLAAEKMDGRTPGQWRPAELYHAMEEWYGDHVPVGLGRSPGRTRAVSGVGALSLLLILLAFTAVMTAATRYLLYPLFRYPDLGVWRPLWGWSLLGPLRRKEKNRVGNPDKS